MELMYLTGAGYFSSDVLGIKRGKITPERRVQEYEIELFTDDYEWGKVNGETIAYRKNRLMIFRPGDVRCSKLGFSCHFIHLTITDRRLCETVERFPRVTELADADGFLRYFREAAALFPPTEEQRSFRLLSCVFGLFAELETFLSRTAQERMVAAEGDAVAIGKVFMTENLHRDIRLADVAAQVHLSPNYFHTLFHKTCGTTPLAYLTEARMAKARRLLLTTAKPISEIAAECGFATYNYFGSQFKSHFGLTPAAYRKARGLYSL